MYGFWKRPINLSYLLNVETLRSEVLIFKFFRTETTTEIMISPAILIALDIIKYHSQVYVTYRFLAGQYEICQSLLFESLLT